MFIASLLTFCLSLALTAGTPAAYEPPQHAEVRHDERAVDMDEPMFEVLVDFANQQPERGGPEGRGGSRGGPGMHDGGPHGRKMEGGPREGMRGGMGGGKGGGPEGRGPGEGRGHGGPGGGQGGGPGGHGMDIQRLMQRLDRLEHRLAEIDRRAGGEGRRPQGGPRGEGRGGPQGRGHGQEQLMGRFPQLRERLRDQVRERLGERMREEIRERVGQRLQQSGPGRPMGGGPREEWIMRQGGRSFVGRRGAG